MVIPALENEISNAIYSRRQATSLSKLDLEIHPFFLRSRTSPLPWIKGLRSLKSAIRQFRPHLIHAQYGTVTAVTCALSSSLPLVVSFRGSDLNPSPGTPWWRSKIGRWLSLWAARRASQIIYVSAGLKSGFKPSRDRAHTIPSGVNLDAFCPMPQDECRAKLGWRQDEKIAVFNAGTNPIGKCQDLAESATKAAQSRIGDIRLHIFDGTTPPDMMPIYLNAANCLLMTSAYEGSPNVIKEALACGLPIVSVNVGDVEQRLAGVEPSIIVKRDSQAFGNAIADIIQDRRRSNGRERVQGLDEKRIARQVREVYHLALGRAIDAPKNE